MMAIDLETRQNVYAWIYDGRVSWVSYVYPMMQYEPADDDEILDSLEQLFGGQWSIGPWRAVGGDTECRADVYRVAP